MPILSDGQIIRGTYEVERFLGEGAFAEVYRVRHRFLGRQAMKVFKRSGMTLAEIEEMLGEAVLLSRIGHPNIVRVFDANVIENQSGLHGFFTMENVPGGSLDRFWRSYGAAFVPVETTVEIMQQVCRGMALAHAESPPIVHRDIKPQNILRARISDFGLAKAVNPLTLLATAAGTLSFKPPETFSKNKADSCAADVWALGVTLYLMLTDQLPFHIDPDLGWTNTKAFEKAPISPSTLNVDVDTSLQDIVFRCIRSNPADRYRNAQELLEVLNAWRKAAHPQKTLDKRSLSSSEPSKVILGSHSPIDAEEGKRLVSLAFQKAKQEGRLFEAADIMEEAFNKSPSLRDKYANQVRLWRCGVSM
jgi:eukaryotic-like serine/threonine-protein kinase